MGLHLQALNGSLSPERCSTNPGEFAQLRTFLHQYLLHRPIGRVQSILAERCDDGSPLESREARPRQVP